MLKYMLDTNTCIFTIKKQQQAVRDARMLALNR